MCKEAIGDDIMKIEGDFCDTTATGSRDGLQMAGWARAIFTAPKRVTVSACPEHHREWNDRIGEMLGRDSDE